MRKETYKTAVRVSRKTAEKAYNAGKIVLIAPCNANMDYIFAPHCYISNSTGEQFNKIINAYEYYNCCYEMGRYCKYFIEMEENAKCK